MVEKLGEIGRRHYVPAKVMYDFDLALAELLANIIIFGYAESNDDHQIRVSVVVAENVLTVHIEGDTKAFDPLATPQPSIDSAIEKSPSGGLGLHIVKTIWIMSLTNTDATEITSRFRRPSEESGSSEIVFDATSVLAHWKLSA